MVKKVKRYRTKNMNFDTLYMILMKENLQVLKLDNYTDQKPINYTGIIIYPDGCKVWCLNGRRHREDGPAIISRNGNKYWYINGKLHREDGPAVENVTGGFKSWWLNGKQYSEQDYKRELIKQGILKDPSLLDLMDAI